MSESENLWNVEQILDEFDKLQTDYEQAQETIQDQEQTISQLEQKVCSLSEKIVMLSESDKELQSVREQKLKLERQKKELKRGQAELRAEVSTLNDRTWRAEQAEREAKQKLDNANSLIQSAVDKNTKAIEEENAQKLQEAKKKTIAVNSSIAPAIALYAVILTLIWAVGKREIVSTFPEWFVRRWENIKTVAEALKTAFMWVHDTLPETWYEAIRYIIPTLMSGVILFGLYIALRSLLKRYTEWNKDIWDKYRREDEEKRLKASYHVVICLVSFLVSILLAEATPLLWFSWYLILSIGGNLAYHKLCENHQSSYSHYW